MLLQLLTRIYPESHQDIIKEGEGVVGRQWIEKMLEQQNEKRDELLSNLQQFLRRRAELYRNGYTHTEKTVNDCPRQLKSHVSHQQAHP